MAGNKYLDLNANGSIQEIVSNDSSIGAGDAGAVVALDSTGRIDTTMMPVGLGADLANVVTSEDLSAGDFVNIYDNGGTPTVRKADATTAGKESDGFVLAATTSPASAAVYFAGTNDQVSGQTIGATVFLQITAGLSGVTVPSASGNVVQRLGRALSATAISFEAAAPITLA